MRAYDAVDHVLEYRNYSASERNVKECCDENREVVGDRGEHKNLLCQRHLMGVGCSMVFVFRHLVGDVFKEAARVGKAYSEENCGEIFLVDVNESI